MTYPAPNTTVGPSAPLSPEWWLYTLEEQLRYRRTNMELMDAYYRGDHPLPFLTRSHDAKMRDEFLKLIQDSRSNFMRLVVDVVEERLIVDGFRLSASKDAQADQATWDIWQANSLDSESQSAFVESLVKGVSYMSVWYGENDGDPPQICVEDPLQTIVAYKGGTAFRERDAALKVWKDDWTGLDRANVYLPDGIYKYQAKAARKTGDIATESARQSERSELTNQRWEPLTSAPSFLDNPLGIVPIIPLRNRPRTLVEGESELADVFRIQNQINGFLFLLALAGYFGAHKQRWATGVKLETDARGKAKDPWDIASDRMLIEENPNVKFGEFQQTDLSGYQTAIDQKVRHIAVTTRTPRHYLEQDGQSPSGDAIKSAESGLVKKVHRKMRVFGEGLEETMRLARRFAGEADSPPDSEIVWADPQVRSEAETTDAAIKKFAAGLIDWEQAASDIGYSQTQIARMKADRAAENPDATNLQVPLQPSETVRA